MSAEADVKLDDFKNIFSLNGKVAVVTGGSRGLGLHAASGYVHIFCFSPSSTDKFVDCCKQVAPKYSSPPAKRKHAKKPAPPSMLYPALAKPSRSPRTLRIQRRSND